ncbi:methyltransferase type 11 [Burkholderia sp. KK1]|nr:methyltransferase type 11 [Burkholderia sp. KK1]
MEATAKAALRRAQDPAFVQRYLTGDGIDIARPDNRLASHAHLFPRLGRVSWWDTTLGGESRMNGIEEASLDFVHANLCLAEQDEPRRSLACWLDLLKAGGYAVITVPDEDRFEKGRWPSVVNPRHKFSFTVSKPTKSLPRSVDVIDLVRSVAHMAECERLDLIDGAAEAGSGEGVIELVLRKREGPTPMQSVHAIATAPDAHECVLACERAIQRHPHHFNMYHFAATRLLHWQELDAMDSIWTRCVEYFGADYLPRLYLVLHTISRGRINEGFAMREALIAPQGWQRRTKAQPPAHIPAWTGEPLEGKSIVIWSEFGLGDEIFFFRFARILRERAGASRVSVVCQSPLTALFRASGEADAVIDIAALTDSPAPAHDFWVFPHAIPAYLPLDLDALPPSVPYLHTSREAPPEVTQTAPGVLKIGLAFKGDPTHENDRARSLPSLSALDDLFALEGIAYFSVQKGAGADEAAAYATKLGNFHDLGANLKTMEQTAAAIAAMDLVVTVDTSIAHVAGALGKPVWLLLPHFGDWRWHYVREDSPWYPQMRLLRNSHSGAWSDVVARLVVELRKLTTS